MGEITDINANQPHYVLRCVCMECKHRFVSVAPVGTDLTRLQCGSCEKMEAIGMIVPKEETDLLQGGS